MKSLGSFTIIWNPNHKCSVFWNGSRKLWSEDKAIYWLSMLIPSKESVRPINTEYRLNFMVHSMFYMYSHLDADKSPRFLKYTVVCTTVATVPCGFWEIFERQLAHGWAHIISWKNNCQMFAEPCWHSCCEAKLNDANAQRRKARRLICIEVIIRVEESNTEVYCKRESVTA